MCQLCVNQVGRSALTLTHLPRVSGATLQITDCPRLVIGVSYPGVWVADLSGQGGKGREGPPHHLRYPSKVPGGWWVRGWGPPPHPPPFLPPFSQ